MATQPYIYEHLRCKGYKVRCIERYLARLDALSHDMFLSPCGIERDELQRRVEAALREGGYSPRHANAVVVRRYVGGGFDVEPVECLYDSFSVRALRSKGYLRGCSGAIVAHNTSAKEAALAFERATAEITDRGVAIWHSDDGEIVSVDGGSVVAVFEGEVRFSHLGEGVEFDSAFEVANRWRKDVTRGAIMVEDLQRAKEVFAVDYRGITSLSRVESKVYIDIVAERLARQVADLER
jgi:branched-subunit amino acid aminotransferase/4-amino-4-deoxychorismate lyase